MGCRTRLRLSRRRDQRHPRRLLAGRRPAPLPPVPARGDERLRGRRLRQVLRSPGCLPGHVGPGRDPPAQRLVRRQARPRPGGRDRRPDQPDGHGRQLPAGGRPAEPVQGRGERLRAGREHARAAAQRARPRLPRRTDAPGPDGDHRPQRRAGARLLRPHPRLQDGPLEPGHVGLDGQRRPRRRTPGGRGAQCRQPGGGARRPRGPCCRDGGARGGRPPRRRRRQGPARQGRDRRRPAMGDRLDRPARHPSELGDDARLRHPAHHRVELPVLPVPAGAWPGTRRPDRRRRGPHRHALPLRGQPRRGLRRDVATAASVARAQGRPVVAGAAGRQGRALVADDGRGGARRRPTRSTRCGSSASSPPSRPTTP